MSGSQAVERRISVDDPSIGPQARAGYFAAMTDTEKLEANLGRRITRRELAAFRSVKEIRAFA